MNVRPLTDADWVRAPRADHDDELPFARANDALQTLGLDELSRWWPDATAVVHPLHGDRATPRSLHCEPAATVEWFGDVDRVIGGAPTPWLSVLAAPPGHRGDPPAVRPELFTAPIEPAASAMRRCEPLSAAHLLRSGAVLRVAKADEIDDRMGSRALAFERASGTLTNIHFYVSDSDQSGSGLHEDTMDVTAFQLTGTKHWVVLHPGASTESEGSGPAVDMMTNVGDGVHLPRGVAHRPTPTGGPSVHVSVATLRPTSDEAAARLTQRGISPTILSTTTPLNATRFDIGARLRTRDRIPLMALTQRLRHADRQPWTWISSVRTGIGIVDHADQGTIAIAVGAFALEIEREFADCAALLVSGARVTDEAIIDRSPAPPEITHQFVATLALIGSIIPTWALTHPARSGPSGGETQ